MPRHPPDALALTLDRSAIVPCPERKSGRDVPALTLNPDMGIMRSVLSVVWINRLCEPANPAFTMSKIRENSWRTNALVVFEADCFRRSNVAVRVEPLACRAVARAASEGWWSQSGSNRRPHACKARALPTELWPLGQKAEYRKQGSDTRFLFSVLWMVGPGRVERPTSRLSGVRSNQLSYRPFAKLTYLSVVQTR